MLRFFWHVILFTYGFTLIAFEAKVADCSDPSDLSPPHHKEEHGTGIGQHPPLVLLDHF
jgi:hypothetical protein